MLGVFLCYDIDDPYISSRIVTSRRCSDDFYILDMSRGNLLQSLSTAEYTRFAIYIDRETGTSTKTDLSFRIHAYGGRIFQDIDSRSPSGKQVRRGFDHFLVQFINHLLFLCYYFDFR